MDRNVQFTRVLRANGIFSGFSGVGLLLFHTRVSDLFGTSATWVFQVVGLALLVFSGHVLLAARRGPARWEALYFTVADVGWVVGSALIVVLGWVPLGAAALLVGAVALIVLIFAAQQWRYRAVV